MRTVTASEAKQGFASAIEAAARVVPITRGIKACRDQRDDKFLDVALAGDARAVITGDRDLLVLNPFHGIPILTPAEFLTWV